MADFILHSIKCLCLDYKDKFGKDNIVFPVCTEVDDNGNIIPHVAQCPNCGNVHLIEKYGQSRLQGKDETSLLPNIEELEFEIPARVSRLLKLNKSPVHFWLAAKYIFTHKLFPNCLILSQEEQQESDKQYPVVITKMLIINDEDKFEMVNDKSDPLGITTPQ